MSMFDKDIFREMNLPSTVEFLAQRFGNTDISTQPGEQSSINLKLIKKRFKAMKLNYERPRDLSLQEKKEFVEVYDLSSEFVQKKLQELIRDTLGSILVKKDFKFIVPSRSSTCTVFNDELCRRLLTRHEITRSYSNTKSQRLCIRTLLVLLIIHERCFINKQRIKKREVFYVDSKLFGTESGSDRVIDDICCMIGCTRPSLRVFADSHGEVIGPFSFRCDNSPFDCSLFALRIPSCDHIVDNFKNHGALFVLLVEKNTVFTHLVEDNFHKKARCIMVTGKGFGHRATKLFLKKLYYGLKLPVLAIVDCNPSGLHIFFDYKYGSVRKSFDSRELATPNIKWLGLRPSDIEKYEVHPGDIPLEGTSVSAANSLLKQQFVTSDKNWVSEIEKMLEIGKMINIENLNLKGSQYLSREFLPKKLEAKDWI